MPLKLSPTQIAFNARGDGKFNQPFREQVDFFRQKLNLPSERYDDILGAAHDRAFVVAGAMKADLLSDFKTSIDQAITDGKSIGWFRKEFNNIVQKHGWLDYTGSDTAKGRAWRTRVIYRTNLASSYAAGRWQQLKDPDLLKTRPYWKYIHNDTVSHPRPLHVSWSGMVLKHDDPWWKTHFPPNGWGCRCRVTAVRAKEFNGATPPEDGAYTREDSAGTRHTIPKGIDLGWDYAPGANTDTTLRDMVQRKIIRYPDAITTALSRDINRHIIANERPAEYADRVLNKTSITTPLWLGFVTSHKAIQGALDIELDGFTVILPSQTPRHVKRSHGRDSGDQRPPRPEDYNLISDILNEYDTIEYGAKTRNGNDSLIAWKEVDGEWYRAVFAIQRGKRNRSLALESLVIKTKR